MGSVGCAGFLCGVVSQKHLIDLSELDTHVFQSSPEVWVCSSSPGAAFKEDLAVHSPRGEFCQWQPREAVLELCLACVCASVMDGVEVNPRELKGVGR